MAVLNQVTINRLDRIWKEDRTLDAVLKGRSIARYGEGELRYAVKCWQIKSQIYDPKLGKELLDGLHKPGDCLIALPRVWGGMPAEKFWRQFERDAYTKHYILSDYGSAFISRSDMVNDIDRPDYWERVRSLWEDKDVVVVGPSPRILPTQTAKSVTFIQGPAVNAYAEIDRIEEEVIKTGILGPILICLGATATVLAIRLARKGIHSIDMGHMGRFMASEGCYNLPDDALYSAKYAEMLKEMHASKEGWGGSGRRQAVTVLKYAENIKTPRILDYGCGQGTLKKALQVLGCKLDIMEYDPGVRGKEKLPKPSELVVCTDVLEHIEPDKLDAVLKHIYNLTKKSAYFLVATRPAGRQLPDGRNAHLIVQPPSYWVSKLINAGFTIDREEIVPGYDVKFWCSKCN